MTATKNTPEKPAEVKPFGRRVEVDFLYLAACSRCVESDASLEEAVETVRPALDAVGAAIGVRKTLVETEEQARAWGS
jgi:hypothetical protein